MNRQRIAQLLSLSVLLSSGSTYADGLLVPALHPSSPSTAQKPAVVQTTSELSEDSVPLNGKEKKAVQLSEQWQNKSDPTVLNEQGAITFTFGNSLPTVICAPLYACDVGLQTGEIVTQVDVGDAARWKITPATSGSGDFATTHLIIKPMDLGLISNMVVSTNRRMYHMRLISKKADWMPMISFTYPESADEAWKQYQATQKQEEASSKTAAQEASLLNFNYRLSGDSPRWKPIRVYSDTRKTYIQFPENAQYADIPPLVLLGENHQPQLVNYRLVGDRYVVDTLIDQAALISGTGRHQERVTITREEQK